MIEFFEFFFLMLVNFIFSGFGAYLLWKKLFENVGNGTGAIGEAISVWIIAVVSFVVMLFVFGMLLYWLIFILEINIWYFVISLIVGLVGFVIFLFRCEILDYFN